MTPAQRPILRLFLSSLFLLTLILTACAQQPMAINGSETGVVRAPELEPNLGWLNTDKPLRFSQELKGQVVLLDFWTYCCINCIHILPDLEYLEKKYAGQPVMIIGVHSAKFENEANRETIRAAIQRYKIQHPVVIDNDMGIWDRYTAQGWPTFVLIDSRGRVVGMDSGEGHREELDQAIQMLLDQGKKDGTLAKEPLKINADVNLMPTGDLAFPGKILADPTGNRLFISDSNHNRIVISTLPDNAGRSRVIGTIGSGLEGAIDGKFSAATFHNPQGLALSGSKLYIADTDNHLIREADLATSTVRTIAGTGKQGYDRRGGGKGTAQVISSPWDVAIAPGNRLIIAMAGLHQIWEMNLDSAEVKVLAGNGRENIVDGPPDAANFAQPSGLAILGDNLYVADSEVSAIRRVDLKSRFTETMVGRGLFVFGDVDGAGEKARLQHALGLAAWKDSLLIADTYNHKIKQLNVTERKVVSLYGSGKPGAETTGSQVAFFEPGGLSVAGDDLYVADTNNHRVVKVNLLSGKWTEVGFEGLSAPQPVSAEKPSQNAIQTPPFHLDNGTSTVTLELSARLPENAHPSPEAPMQVKLTGAGGEMLYQQTLKTDKLPVQLEVPATDLPASGTMRLRWSFAWCTTGKESVCVPRRVDWEVPVERTAGGSTSIQLIAP